MELHIAAFVVVLLLSVSVTTAVAAPPAHFVFGDSLLDCGNNNYIASIARADHYPHGIDYPSRLPTGRFSNGLNLADFISLKLGAEPVLPYLDPFLKGNALLRGANFASAGIGILNDTGLQFGQIIRMPEQFQHFQEYQDRVASIIGVRSLQYSIPAYTKLIMSEFEKYLAGFYELGARRVLVLAAGPMGCVPMERATRSKNGECAAELQQASSIFNSLLRSAVNRLNSRFSGIGDGKDACCGQGPYNGLGICSALSSLCPDRDNNVWWDQFHPTERASRIIVDRFFSGSPSDVSPISLRDLLKLDV